MAEKKITVVIDGQEFVSKAADSAGGAMDGFAGKIPGWGKAIALATAAFAILSKAVEAVTSSRRPKTRCRRSPS